MAEQLKEVCPLAPQRPLGLFDSEYGSGVIVKQTEGVNCDLPFRLRPNRKLRLVSSSTCGEEMVEIGGKNGQSFPPSVPDFSEIAASGDVCG